MRRCWLFLVIATFNVTVQASTVHAQGIDTTTTRPLIVVVGFQGSTLVDTSSGMRIWGSFTGSYAHPDRPDGMRAMALPMHVDEPLDRLTDHVAPDGVLNRFRFDLLRLIPMYAQGYAPLMRTLREQGYRFAPPGSRPDSGCYDAFVFTYDWRRDNAESARRLDRFLREKQNDLERQAQRCGHPPDFARTFDLVAHSMGALIVRYFLRYGGAPLGDEGRLPRVTWTGARVVHEAVLAAPPNSGSLQALEALIRGRTYLPGSGRYKPAVLGTMPALYELLPRNHGGGVVRADDPLRSVGDLFDPRTWEQLGWGLADPAQTPVLRALLPDATSDEDRRRIALDHLGKCLRRARRFVQAIEAPASAPPSHLIVRILAGDDRPTDAVAAWDAGTRRLRIVERRSGDGRVLRTSAVAPPAADRIDGIQSALESVTYVRGEHMGMLTKPTFAHELTAFLEGHDVEGKPSRPHAAPEVWIGAARVRPIPRNDLVMSRDVEARGAPEATMLLPLHGGFYAGFSGGYAFVPAPPPHVVAEHISPGPGLVGTEGGALHFLGAGFILEYRLTHSSVLQPFLRFNPGATWVLQTEVEGVTRSPTDSLDPRLRRKRTASAVTLPAGIGVALPLRGDVSLTVLIQRDLRLLWGAQRSGLLESPLRIGLRFAVR